MLQLPYKKLIMWQKSIDLVDRVCMLTARFPKEEIFVLTSQIRRSTVSVPSNIAEGSQRKTDKEFLHFLSIRMGSLSELETQSIIARRRRYFTEAEHENLLAGMKEVHKMIFSFSRKLEQKRANAHSFLTSNTKLRYIAFLFPWTKLCALAHGMHEPKQTLPSGLEYKAIHLPLAGKDKSRKPILQ